MAQEGKVEQKHRLLLRKAGHKTTPARLRVLEFFEKSKNPPSAQDVIDALGNFADTATIYRTLKTLKNKGLIRQVDLRHNHAHYEIYREDEHHHLICLRCGKIEDVHDCGVDESKILRHSKRFAEIKHHALEFYGLCKTCVKSEK